MYRGRKGFSQQVCRGGVVGERRRGESAGVDYVCRERAWQLNTGLVEGLCNGGERGSTAVEMETVGEERGGASVMHEMRCVHVEWE
jgi:hypothetical protein